MSKRRKQSRATAPQPPGEIVDRSTLVAALRAAGIPDGANYEVPELVRLARDVGPYWFLVQRDGRWVVGSRERTLELIEGTYETEGEAARAFFDFVRRDWWARRHPAKPSPDAPRLSHREILAETQRLEKAAEQENAERERRISEE